jgi:tartrate dehydratase beta subunit/fumarate hydratase class I family protein
MYDWCLSWQCHSRNVADPFSQDPQDRPLFLPHRQPLKGWSQLYATGPTTGNRLESRKNSQYEQAENMHLELGKEEFHNQQQRVAGKVAWEDFSVKKFFKFNGSFGHV